MMLCSAPSAYRRGRLIPEAGSFTAARPAPSELPSQLTATQPLTPTVAQSDLAATAQKKLSRLTMPASRAAASAFKIHQGGARAGRRDSTWPSSAIHVAIRFARCTAADAQLARPSSSGPPYHLSRQMRLVSVLV